MKKELRIKNNECEIYGAIYYPDGAVLGAVILSHGYNGSHKDFDYECQRLAENGYIAYAYDFCGGSTNGMSQGRATVDMTLFTEKSDLIAVFNYIKALPELEGKKLYLFGGSQGGMVSCLAAEELADELSGLMLYYPALNIPEDWRKRYASEADIPKEVDFWDMKLGEGFFKSIRDFVTFDNIGKFSKPALIIYGKEDPVVPFMAMEKAKQTYPDMKLEILNGEGHGFTRTGTMEATRKLLEFLKNH